VIFILEYSGMSLHLIVLCHCAGTCTLYRPNIANDANMRVMNSNNCDQLHAAKWDF
jgi:hypothetical protein